MTDPILIACLVQLRAEFNAIAPARDKTSDGWIGDTAHQAEVSDHNPDETGNVPIHDADSINEVHAVDVDSTGPWPFDGGMETIVQHLLARCRSGAETRLRYLIYRRRTWSASSSWVEKAYTGASPHEEHAHFSASYNTGKEASTASWHLEELVALTDDDITRLVNAIKGADINPADDSSYSLGGALWTMLGRSSALNSLPAQVDAVGAKVDHVLALPATPVDVAALATQLAEALPPALAAQLANELAARLAA
jgi:hypothetical protein